MKRIPCLLLILFLTLALPGFALCEHGAKRPQRTGILLAAFGTTQTEAFKAYDSLEKQVRQAHPGMEVRWAFTSRQVRDTLRASKKRQADSPSLALARMLDDGFTHVAILPLHVAPGREYHDLAATTAAFRGIPKGFTTISMAGPLLGNDADIVAAARALADMPGRKPGEALLLMGHGGTHGGNTVYAALQYHLSRLDPLALVGTVEGTPSLDDVLTTLSGSQAKGVRLMPLMAVAGEHSRNDMAGSDPESWLSRLKAAGFACSVQQQGLAEKAAFAALWLAHLDQALSALEAGH